MRLLMDWAQIKEFSDNLAANPPVTAFYASHSVPYGRHFAQYLTDGRKIVWVNRGEVADIAPPVSLPHVRWGALTGVLGIPIFNV